MASFYIVFGTFVGGQTRNPKGEIAVILNSRITCCAVVCVKIFICPDLQSIPELALIFPKDRGAFMQIANVNFLI